MADCLPEPLEKPNTSEPMLQLSEDEDSEASENYYERNIAEEEFNFLNSSTCWICNGYYGPNFDEPLCGTCHAFLYHEEPGGVLETTISDDEDSGNDEPPFKDKAEVDDDEDVDEDEEDDDAAEVEEDLEDVDMIEAQPEADQAVHEGAIAPIAAPPAERHLGFGNSPQREHERRLLAQDRPRPLAPHALPHYVELLSDARANAQAAAAEGSLSSCNITALPVEIMVIIFSHLDDISMWTAGEVCKRWLQILEATTSQTMWRKYLKERWPLFQSIVEVPNWHRLYRALMNSCFCRTCLVQMALRSPQQLAQQNAIRMNFLRNDFRLLNSYTTEGVEAIPLDNQNTYWQASILGPAGSPYEGGKFFLFIFFPEGYVDVSS